MTELARFTAIGIGALQVLANGLLLARGVTRLPAELAREKASARTADLLGVAWTYGMLGNLCLAVLLVSTAYRPREDPWAWRTAAIVGVYYVVVGVSSWLAAGRRHRGLLVFALLGLVLLGALAS